MSAHLVGLLGKVGQFNNSLVPDIFRSRTTRKTPVVGLYSIMPSPATPKSWPQEVLYLSQLQYARNVDRNVFASSTDSTLPICSFSAGPCTLVKIVTITDPANPAHGGCGLFAARNLPPDSIILFYLGFVHGEDDADVASNYDLSFDRERQIGIDASRMGNEARFINDYRGIRKAGPNAEFRDCYADLGGGRLEKRIGVFVLGAGQRGKRAKGIAKGEEIVVSYGKGFWTHRKPQDHGLEND